MSASSVVEPIILTGSNGMLPEPGIAIAALAGLAMYVRRQRHNYRLASDCRRCRAKTQDAALHGRAAFSISAVNYFRCIRTRATESLPSRLMKLGSITLVDKLNGGIAVSINQPGDVPKFGGREYDYSGPRHPFDLCERIYGSDDILLERMKLEGFTVQRRAIT